jgi:hypothetical protein
LRTGPLSGDNAAAKKGGEATGMADKTIPPFRFLSEEEFNKLSQEEKIRYLALAMEARNQQPDPRDGPKPADLPYSEFPPDTLGPHQRCVDQLRKNVKP